MKAFLAYPKASDINLADKTEQYRLREQIEAYEKRLRKTFFGAQWPMPEGESEMLIVCVDYGVDDHMKAVVERANQTHGRILSWRIGANP